MSRLLALTFALLAGLLPGHASAAEPAPGKHALPATPEAWLAQMLDGRRNGTAFKDPAAFAAWLDAVSEPRFMTALATAAVDPATYPEAAARAMDPEAARNWSEFTDPQLYLRWLLAGANPSFQQAILRTLTDPAKMTRWIEAMSRPDGYAAMSAAFARAPAAWLGAALSQASYAPAISAAQPATAMTWFGTLAGGMAKVPADAGWQQLPTDKLSGARYRY